MNINDSLKWSINDLTDRIRECYKISSPIVNIKDVINQLEGQIDFANVSASRHSILEKTRDNDVNFKITISNFISYENLRFQLAFDIGHLFLHMGYIINDERWESSDSVLRKYAGEMQLQADEFARSLLMPRNLFGKAVLGSQCNDGKYDLKVISSYFGTPINQTLKRGIDLGYMQNAWL